MQPFFDDEITLLSHIIPTQIDVVGLSMVSTFVTMAGHAVEISASNYSVVNGNETSAIEQSNMVAINGFINILDVVALVPEEARPTDPDPLDVCCCFLGLIIPV